MIISWIAHYIDGTQLKQSDGATYRDIDRDRLLIFELLKDNQTLVAVDFRDDTGGDAEIGPKRLIWRKRKTIGTAGQSTSLHLVGWQRMVKGRNIQAILYINEETGQMIMEGQPFEAPQMHPVQLFPQEMA